MRYSWSSRGTFLLLLIIVPFYLTLKHVNAESYQVAIIKDLKGDQISVNACISPQDIYGGIDEVKISYSSIQGSYDGYYLATDSQSALNLKIDNSWASGQSSNYPYTFVQGFIDQKFTNYTSGQLKGSVYVGITYNPSDYLNFRNSNDLASLDSFITKNGGQEIPINTLTLCSDAALDVTPSKYTPPISVQTTTSNSVTPANDILESLSTKSINNSIITTNIYQDCSLYFKSSLGNISSPILYSSNSKIGTSFLEYGTINNQEIQSYGYKPCQKLHMSNGENS
jgi:hypothetical protein